MINHLQIKMTLCSAGWEIDSLAYHLWWTFLSSQNSQRTYYNVQHYQSSFLFSLWFHIKCQLGAHRVVLLPSLLCLQIESSYVALDIAVEHGLPELHSGPHHVLLYAAVGKLSDACAQFLSDKHGKRLL